METSVPPIPGLAMFWEKFFNLLGADTKNFMAMAASIKPESRPSEFSPDENEVPAVGLKMLLTGDQRNRDDIKQTLSSGDFRALLVHLSDNIASLSREVGDLRIILERQSRRLSDSSDSPAHAPSKVSLDFESFLSQRLG